VVIEPDYRGYRIEVTAELADGAWVGGDHASDMTRRPLMLRERAEMMGRNRGIE